MERDFLGQLDAVFADIACEPDDVQFEAWNDAMTWLQQAMPRVAASRRQALWRYYKSGNLTRRELTDRFPGLTITTASRLMDEASKELPETS